MTEAEQGRTSSRAAWWKHELHRGLVLFLYLWTLLALFVLNEDVANRQTGHPFMFQGFALVNALILAKVMLVSEQLDLSRRLSTWPRIWVILCESLSCAVLFLIVHTLERIVIGLIHGQSLSSSMPSFGGGGVTGTLIVGLIFFVSLLPFFTFKNVARVIGVDRVLAILFKRPGSLG